MSKKAQKLPGITRNNGILSNYFGKFQGGRKDPQFVNYSGKLKKYSEKPRVKELTAFGTYIHLWHAILSSLCNFAIVELSIFKGWLTNLMGGEKSKHVSSII